MGGAEHLRSGRGFSAGWRGERCLCGVGNKGGREGDGWYDNGAKGWLFLRKHVFVC